MSERKKRIYIAGPMSGYPRYNVDTFDSAAQHFRMEGFEVFNPADMDRDAGFDHYAVPQMRLTQSDKREFMRRDLMAICRCNAIALLPGWEKSKGVKVELALAEFLGLMVFNVEANAWRRFGEDECEPEESSLLIPGLEFTVDSGGCVYRDEALRLQAAGAVFEYRYEKESWTLQRSPLSFVGGRYFYRLASPPPEHEVKVAPNDDGTFTALEDSKPVELPDSGTNSTPTVTVDEPETILDEAKRITAGDRQNAYGPPDQDFARTAAMWSQLLGVDVEARQVALCMIALKLSRETHQRKRDNWVDIAGYAKCGSVCR